MSLALSPRPPPRKGDCPAPAALESLLAEPATAPSPLAAHVETCADCSSYVAALRAEQSRFLAARPKEMFVAQVERRAQLARKRSPLLAWAGAGTAAALAIGIVVVNKSQPGVEFKGSLVTIHVLREGAEHPLLSGEALHPRDALRFVVHAKSAGYAAVFERDANGQVTVVAPFDARSPAPIAAGSTALPDSAQLDGVLGKELLVTVFSTEPFELTAVANQLKQNAPAACGHCVVDAAQLDKLP